MESLRAYLNSLAPDAQADYAVRCGTSVGYLRKALSVRQPLREGLCINLDRESGGAVPCTDVRPDVDWEYLRTRPAHGNAVEPQAGEAAHG